MSVGGRLAAMMPASRAACSGSPFFDRAGADRAARRARHRDRGRARRPRASVTGLSPTSTIRMRPRASTCVKRGGLRHAAGLLRRRPRHSPSPCARIERQALERHRQVDALQLHVRRHLQRARREVEHGLDARRRRPGRRTCCADAAGHGDDGDVDAARGAAMLLQFADVVDRHAAARLAAPILASALSKSATISKPSWRKPG